MARTQAGNFYHGMKLTPEPRRAAIYAVYAFMRACDDLADEAGPGEDTAARRRAIDSFRARMDHAITHARGGADHAPPPDTLPPRQSVWPAFIHVMRTYPIDPADLHHMLDGQLADLSVHRYATFDDLYRYCYNVASTVGLVCIAVWGYEGGAATRELAQTRGIALQLTNILRDLREDAQRGRVYLPADELDRFGVRVEDLAVGRASAEFDGLMAFQIKRAREHYAASATLDQFISRDCRPTSWAIMRIYEKLLDRIAADPRAVLRQRVRLPLPTKVGVALRAMVRR